MNQIKEFDEIKTLINSLREEVKGVRSELKGLIEIQQRLIHERLGVPVPPAPKEFGEEPGTSKNKIEITDASESGRIKISGKTFDYNNTIKAAGQAKWDGSSKTWSMSIDALDNLILGLESCKLVRDKDFTVKVSKNSSKDSGFGSGF